MVDFPASPTNGQTFTTGGIVFKFNGTAWVSNISTASYIEAPTDSKMYGRFNATWARAVALGGDTMTGDLTNNGESPVRSVYWALRRPAGTYESMLLFYRGGKSCWRIGDDTGKSFALTRWNDATDAVIDTPLSVNYTSGDVAVGTNLTTGTGHIYAGADKSFGMRQHASYPNILFSIDGRRLELNRTSGAFYFVGATNNILFNFDPSGNFSCAGINGTSYNYATHLRNNGNAADTLLTFRWAGQSGTPSWVLGATDAQYPNIYVYSPAQFSVNYANSAGSAPANGGTAQNSNQVGGIGGWAYRNDSNNPAYLWCTEGNTQAQHLTAPGNLSVNYANRSNWVNTLDGASGGYVSSTINCQTGYLGRAGVNGGTTNVMNTSWTGSSYQCYVDSSFIGNINFLSDERIKRDIATLAPQHDAFMQLVPISYRWRDIGIYRDDGLDHWGWSAQNVKASVPKAVTGKEDDVTLDGDIQPMAVDDRPLLALTVLEVQSLWAEIAALKAEIAQLKGQA